MKDRLKRRKKELSALCKLMINSKGELAVEFHRSCDRVSIISHTGGTTGEPKGVMLTDRAINSVIWQMGIVPHRRQDRFLVVLPPFVNYSLVNSMLLPLAFGMTSIMIPKYEPDRLDEYIEKYQPNHINSIPAYWEAALENEKMKTMDLSCLKYTTAGGEGLNEKKENEINDFLYSCGVKLPLGKGLGCTEMVSATTFTYDGCNKIGSVGVPLPKYNCKIVEPGSEIELAYNQEGEICFTGASLMSGYYGKAEATAEVIKIHEDDQQWLHTGDLGYMTEEGILYVTGRIKRIIMTKGTDGIVTKMFPDRIEKVVLQHPYIGLCCVVGVPDEDRINYPKAFVVLETTYEVSDKLKDEILNLCQEKLPMYMVPNDIEFRTELPLTERGKVDYRALEKEAKALGGNA